MALKSVGFYSFEQEALKNDCPVVLLCMHRGREFSSHAEVLRDTAEAFPDRLVPLVLDEEFIEPFRHRFGVKGTPTFLVFFEGREMGRLLGQHDRDALYRLIKESLSL